MTNYPNLELIEYKAKQRMMDAYSNAGFGYVCIYDLEMDVFRQTWSNTATGFDLSGGCSGQAFTNEYTTVCRVFVKFDDDSECDDVYVIFFGNEIAYVIVAPNDKFFEDIKSRNMFPQSKAKLYKQT